MDSHDDFATLNPEDPVPPPENFYPPEEEQEESPPSEPEKGAEEPAPESKSGRVMSIDALRGFDMFWIIGGHGLVLTALAVFIKWFPGFFRFIEPKGLLEPFMKPGLTDFYASVRHQMSHPAWEGFSAWDMIMPLFLFIVGVVMPFSFAKRIEKGATKGELYRKIFIRTVILFILGMAVQGRLLEYDLSRLHIYCNTLQAIACGYLVAGILLLNVRALWQFVAIPVLLVAYWALMMFVPVPGHGAGVLEPHANLALYIDKLILGRFQDQTTYTWILSGLGFSATVLLGVMAGHILRAKTPSVVKALFLFLAGGVCLALGWAWGVPPSPVRFPIIKHIWTSSMVLWAGGWSFLLMGFFYLVIDVIGFRSWAFPFAVIGMNAIFIYVTAHLFNFQHIGNIFVGGLARKMSDPEAQLLKNAAAFASLWLILFYMYRKKTFIKV